MFFDIISSIKGSYTLTATCTGYVSRSYSFELEGDTELEIVLWQQGDSNGDGKINIGDTVRMYSHVRQMLLIEDPYLVLCADTDGNGIVNIGDVVRSYVAIRNG